VSLDCFLFVLKQFFRKTENAWAPNIALNPETGKNTTNQETHTPHILANSPTQESVAVEIKLDKKIPFEQSEEFAELNALRARIEQLEHENQQLRTLNQTLQGVSEQAVQQVDNLTIQVSELQQQLWLQNLKNKLENPCDRQPLRVAELGDFILANPSFSSSGQFGTVHGVRTNWNRLEKRIAIPEESQRAYWEIVALKMLFNFNQPKANPTMEQKTRFDQEYFFPLAHPHWSIIQVFNYFRSDLILDLLPDRGYQHRDDPLFATKTTYFTMEAGQGTLEEFVVQYPITDWKTGLLIVVQILWGVEHISSLGFAHLDLKMDNIIWLFNQRPSIGGNQFVIGDLGTACYSPVNVARGCPIPGNQANRAPEVLRHAYGQVEVIFNDIWAVGCILFELFQKRHPFLVGDPDALENRICDLELPRLDQKWGLGCAKLLDMMWKRKVQERISPLMAARLCSLLLWGFPLVDLQSIHSPDPRVFSEAIRTLSTLSTADCQSWITTKKHEFYQEFSRLSGTRLDIEPLLHAQFLTNITPEDLLACVRLFK
jgi:serine/threonine protein kinase